MGNMSTLDRMLEADKLRGRNLVPAFAEAQARARHLEDSASQRHFEAVARTLSDDVVADDPEVKRLAAEAAAKDLRAKRVARTSCREELKRTMQRLHDQIGCAEKEIRLAAVDDALDGALDFPRAVRAAGRMEPLRRQLDAAQIALAVLMKSPLDRTEFEDDATTARNALREALLSRKTAYLLEHPELLVTSSATSKPEGEPAHG